MRILGVDPGIHGGLALVEISDGVAPQLVDAIDIFTVDTGTNERVDAIALAGCIAAYRRQRLSRSDAFLDFAERQTPAAVKARQRAAAKRREKAKEKALQERDDLFRLWKQWRHERLEALLAGPYGEPVRER